MSGGPEWIDNRETRLEPLDLRSPSASLDMTQLDATELPEAERVALELELARALRPVALPAGFAERVLARAAAEAPRQELQKGPRRAKVLAFPGWRVALGGAVAAALVVGSLVGVDVRQSHERARARAAATQQFETATRITDAALEHTRAQLERAGVFGQ